MIAQLNDIAQIWWQWIAGMFWQVSLFIILITLLDMSIRRWAWPQVRYVLWGLVFLKLIIPPTWQMPTSIVSWIQPQIEKQISIQIAPVDVTDENQQVSASSMVSQTQVPKPVMTTEKASWHAIVLLTWVAGMIAFGLMLIIKMSRIPKQSKNQDEQNSPEWFNGLLTKTAQSLKLRKTPTVVFSNDAKSPAVYGIFKPVLLLPEGCLDQLSQEETEHVLIHELCHLKRGDLLVHWFCLILQIVYWFNPLLIWTRRQMRHVCEICCDLSVADVLREKTIGYRNTLLATARELLAETVEPGLGLLGVFEEPFRLVSRLKWLEKKTWENRKQKTAVTMVTCLIMVVCVMPMAGHSQTTRQDNSHPDYKLGVEYDNADGKTEVLSFPMVLLEAFFVEVDENKDLNLGAEFYYSLNPNQMEVDCIKDNSASAKNKSDNLEVVFSSKVPPKQKRDGTTTKSTPYDFKEQVEFGRYSSPQISSIFSAMPQIRVFTKGINIGGKSFPDMETAVKTIEPRSALMQNIPIPSNKMATIKIPASTGDQEHVLGITPKILENGDISQKIILQAYKSKEEPKGVINMGTNGIKTENSTTLVISGPTSHAINEGVTTNKTKLYIFLTPHVIKTAEEVKQYLKANTKDPAAHVVYTERKADKDKAINFISTTTEN